MTPTLDLKVAKYRRLQFPEKGEAATKAPTRGAEAHGMLADDEYGTVVGLDLTTGRNYMPLVCTAPDGKTRCASATEQLDS